MAESIADWLKEKEAEYQAQLLSAEVEKIRQEDEAESKAGDKKGKKSPRKSGMGIEYLGMCVCVCVCVCVCACMCVCVCMCV